MKQQKQSEYASKLLDPRWQKKRLEILERDKFTCFQCGSDQKTLHVHHSYYIKGRDPWNYPNWSLSTLCKRCHEIEQNLRRYEFSPFEWAVAMLGGETPRRIVDLYLKAEDARCELQADIYDFLDEILSEMVARKKSFKIPDRKEATESPDRAISKEDGAKLFSDLKRQLAEMR